MEIGKYYKCDSFSNTGASIVGEYLGGEMYQYTRELGHQKYKDTFRVIMSDHAGYPPGRIIVSINMDKDNWIEI